MPLRRSSHRALLKLTLTCLAVQSVCAEKVWEDCGMGKTLEDGSSSVVLLDTIKGDT